MSTVVLVFTDKLSTYFQYSEAIRKLIYTTNTIEGFHRQVRKITKNEGGFHFQYGCTEIDLPGHSEYPKEMDAATSELEPHCIPAINYIRRPVKIAVVDRGANAAPLSPGEGFQTTIS